MINDEFDAEIMRHMASSEAAGLQIFPVSAEVQSCSRHDSTAPAASVPRVLKVMASESINLREAL